MVQNIQLLHLTELLQDYSITKIFQNYLIPKVLNYILSFKLCHENIPSIYCY